MARYLCSRGTGPVSRPAHVLPAAENCMPALRSLAIGYRTAGITSMSLITAVRMPGGGTISKPQIVMECIAILSFGRWCSRWKNFHVSSVASRRFTLKIVDFQVGSNEKSPTPSSAGSAISVDTGRQMCATGGIFLLNSMLIHRTSMPILPHGTRSYFANPRAFF